MVTSKRNGKQKEQKKNIMVTAVRQAKDCPASALACGAPIGRLGLPRPPWVNAAQHL
ncbi:hypothetical protein ACVIGA_003631 [Bradyrhizobium sp. USDA 3240]